MRKTILSIVCLCLGTLLSTQAQTIKDDDMFWDGHTWYHVSEITPDGTVIFSGANFDPQLGFADGVDVLRLKKTKQPGKYVLSDADAMPFSFRCKVGAEVQYIRQNGMNFLAVKNSKGQIVETLVYTVDNVENLYYQQQQMITDLLSDLNGMSDAMLMNTNMTIAIGYQELQTQAARLAKVKNPDIITRTNAQLLQTELDFREGKAEGGYNNPDGLGGDGRGTDELASDGPFVTIDGVEYQRVTTAEEFVKALASGSSVLVARNTTINLTTYLDQEEAFTTADRQWRDERSIGITENTDRPFIASEAVFDGRQLTLAGFKQIIIRGEKNSRLVVEPRYAFVLRFVNCQQVEIQNLTIGHTEGGYCEGGVIGVTGGWRISIHDSDLYGCGTYGFELEQTSDFSCHRSVIHDCTYGIMLVRNTESACFETCDFLHNREFSLVDSRNSELVFNDCRFFANDGDAPLFDVDQPFWLSGCEIYHPTENLGTINLADQSGAKNWFSENPFDPDIKDRGIGHDAKKK